MYNPPDMRLDGTPLAAGAVLCVVEQDVCTVMGRAQIDPMRRSTGVPLAKYPCVTRKEDLSAGGNTMCKSNGRELHITM